MEAKGKLNVEYPDTDLPILRNTSNLINLDQIYNYGRQFSECAIVFLYLTKPQEIIEYLLFFSTHVPTTSLMDSVNIVEN